AEPLLAASGLLRGDAEAHRAARRTDAEPVALVDVPQARDPEVLLDGEIAGNDELLRLRRAPRLPRALLFGGLEHQRAEHQLFLRRRARSDEQPIERHARKLADGDDLIGGERLRDLRLE